MAACRGHGPLGRTAAVSQRSGRGTRRRDDRGHALAAVDRRWLAHAACAATIPPPLRLDRRRRVLLVGLHSLAALRAVWQESPRPALNMLWEWIGFGLAYFLARQLLDTQRQARAVVAVMIALAAGLSGYGLYQRAVEMPLARAAYAADMEGTLRQAGIAAPPGSPERQYFEARLQNNEPIATFALTNSLAAVLAPWFVLAIGVAATKGNAGRCDSEGAASADSPPLVSSSGTSD